MLVGIQGDGSRGIVPALPSLRKIGGFRIQRWKDSSYALAGSTGPGRPSWVKQQQKPRHRGPSVVKVSIPLLKIPKGNAFCLMNVFFPNGSASNVLV
mgnify:CR=1 FL=1